jgi:hypothetical protein
MYYYLSSDDSLLKGTADFRIPLSNPIELAHTKSVALAEIQLPATEAVERADGDGGNLLFIYTSICENSNYNDGMQPILRMYDTRFANQLVRFSPLFYIPIKQSWISEIRIFVRTLDRKRPSFHGGNCYCTLHIV